MSKYDDDPAAWAVVDRNATELQPNSSDLKPRVHDVAPGIRFSLLSDRPTKMPEKYARLFLKDPAFVVTNAAGQVIAGLSEQQNTRIATSAKLPHNIVYAQLDELTDDALRTRASVHPRFTDMPTNPDRAMMIDFLQGMFAFGDRGDGSEDDLEDGREDTAAVARRLLEA